MTQAFTALHLFSRHRRRRARLPARGASELSAPSTSTRSPAAISNASSASPPPCADLGTMTPRRAARRVHRAAGRRLHFSPPCVAKLSGCLPAAKAVTRRRTSGDERTLALRGVWLTLEAWARAAAGPLFVLENVPRIHEPRSRVLAGPARRRCCGATATRCSETTHDCGELGGLRPEQAPAVPASSRAA
jgi:hypothetical protein